MLNRPMLDVVVFDSHAKAGTLANWIATHQGVTLKRVNFSAFGASEDHVTEYIDLASPTGSHRIVICTFATFRQPLMRPIVRGAGRAILLFSHDLSVKTSDLFSAFVANADCLDPQAEICCAAGRDHVAIKDEMTDKNGLMQTPVWADVDPGDYAEIWSLVQRTNSSIKRSQGSNAQQASATTAVPPAKATVVQLPIQPRGKSNMANATETLGELMKIDGALGGLIADYTSGMLLAKAGGGVNLDIAAAGNSEVIKSKLKTMAALGLKEAIEDILITLGTQYHIIRPIPSKQGLFLYLVLDKAKANLAMARFKVSDIEKSLAI